MINIEKARGLVSEHLQPTPLVFSKVSRGDQRIYFKLETQQPTGSFKVRPAFCGILSQFDEVRQKGVVASSSGNFAKAVAYVAKKLGVRARLIMMQKSSPLKISQTREFGGEVYLCGNTYEDRVATAERIRCETGSVLLHPFDSELTIAGDGTIALELLEQIPEPFSVITPVSGGGLLAGVAFGLKALRPDCQVFGVQPEGNQAMIAALKAGKVISSKPAETVADAVVTTRPGEIGFPIIQKYVDDVVAVPEAEIIPGVHRLYFEEKLIAEPAAVLPLLALQLKLIRPRHRTIVMILSGGNVTV